MTQYFFIDESGDPGLDSGAGSSSHFVVAMVQSPQQEYEGVAVYEFE